MKRSTQIQNLINQVPALDGYTVERQGRSYFARHAVMPPLYFQSATIAVSWLTRWIETGDKPPLSLLRQR